MSDAQTLTAPAAAPQGLRRTPYRRLLKIASHHKIGAAAFGGVIIVCLLALTAPILAPYDPFEQDYNSLLQAPSWAHPFGTDRVGRDILTRVLYGTQVSVLVGLVAVGISIVPAVRPDAGSGSGRERAHYMSKLNQSDMVLIYRILTSRVPANTVAATNNGNVSLSRLEGAGLVVNESNELKLTDRAETALGLSRS